MTERTREHNKQLHRLHHDIQNCLNAISMIRGVLKLVREDEARFKENFESMGEEIRTAAGLVEDFLKATCQGCD